MVYWTTDYFKLLYNQFLASGMSARGFCKENDIQENRFYYWIRKLKSEALPQIETPNEFIPLNPTVVSSLTRKSIDLPSEQTACKKTQQVKISYPNGVVLELGVADNAEFIKQLITLNPETNV